jgi:hypothetical protein
MPALNLPLCLRIIRRAADMLDFLAVEPFCEIGRYVRGSIVRQQSRGMPNIDLIQPAFGQHQIQRIGDVLRLHRHAELPGDDIARVVVQDGRQIIPAPTSDLQIGEVRLPKLVWSRRLFPELIRRLDHDIGGASDQILRLEKTINRCPRHKIALLIREQNRQLTR